MNEDIINKIYCKKVGNRYYIFVDDVPKIVTDEIGFTIITNLKSGYSIQEIEQQLKKNYLYHDEDICQDIVDFIEKIKKIHA